MKKRNKTKDTSIRTEFREKDGILYKYELKMRESLDLASYKIPLYAISIEMKRESGETTNADTSELFADVGRAIVFFERLVENYATPLNLPYIVEDEIYN